MSHYKKGELVIIGGAEDKYGDSRILEEVVRIIGGEDARVGIITTATQHPEEVGEEYRNVFLRLGVRETDIISINSREEANLDDNVKRIRDVSGFFFTGGDQLRITSILGGTKVYEALLHSFDHGTPVIGTSAGASVMCSTMIVEGNSNDAARKCTLKMAPGLRLLEGVIIDQHFDQRGRLGRLLCGIAENPGILGIGIDEDTAIRVYPEEYFEVLGNNAVTVIDGRSIKSTNVSELEPDEILTITNASLHVLSKGYGFDFKRRELISIN
ncbi:cyanophycinase [Syntrophomonas wolfei]|uniref:Cyanophycinase n=1 Tax=Syntrophomonas wolfei subsp. wolfei (strain DSM 2245B / Goettingen) TaxID=335541 RepID=Q0AX95_SYNWW|nr:cyanophycinase [Syntrophomonas wolfei]ABI68659.1 cyanophycinase [Syntrophomonas wolfei subsp. wolfei str. Goettingen G311]